MQQNYFVGALEVITNLHKNAIPMAISSSNTYDTIITKIINHYNFFNDYFTHIQCYDPENNCCHEKLILGKPEPDLLIECVSKFKKQPHPEQVPIIKTEFYLINPIYLFSV